MGDFDYKEISTTQRQIFIIINDFFIFLFFYFGIVGLVDPKKLSVRRLNHRLQFNRKNSYRG